MTLFIERLFELLLRQKGMPLTPDKIRYALSKVHTMHFKETDTERQGKMESSLNEDAEKIFNVLGISSDCVTGIIDKCCA